MIYYYSNRLEGNNWVNLGGRSDQKGIIIKTGVEKTIKDCLWGYNMQQMFENDICIDSPALFYLFNEIHLIVGLDPYRQLIWELITKYDSLYPSCAIWRDDDRER